MPIYKNDRLLLFFIIQTADPISLCLIVFYKVEIVLIYMELHETIRAQGGSCIQSILQEKWYTTVMTSLVPVNMDVFNF